MTTNNVIILLMSWGGVVIPSSEWGIFCYAHTVDGKKPDRRRKYFVVFLG